ncbi:unnamed protein product [Trichobilharzia szidati]|nr:unnamed protein product [Trichobilharzia szidati]CAH8865491.1 unnamed protein product [Trichobilharzia szidati]CAH8865493.1 unnamed protein product [Trichobilharzia szidati]
MERDTILENFLACTGVTDITYGISVLEEHDWDLSAAVFSVIGDGLSGTFDQEDQSFPCTTSYSVTPGQTGPIPTSNLSVNHNSNSQNNISVSTMCGFDSTIPDDNNNNNSNYNLSSTLSRSVIERDNNPDNLCGSVRILNFEIELELPLDDDDNDNDETDYQVKKVTETFQFPDTETVGFLKCHFIDCRLTELIQLATSPALESKITECSKANLMKHLVFESSGSHSFMDNSALLRSLHLPKCVRLQAKLSPDPLPDSSTSVGSKLSEPVKLYISVYEDATRDSGSSSSRTTHDTDEINADTILPSSSSSAAASATGGNRRQQRQRNAARSSSPYAYHCMRLPLSSRISQVRGNLFRITGIPIPCQTWCISDKQSHSHHHQQRLVNEQMPSRDILNLLVNELNYHQRQKRKSTSSGVPDCSSVITSTTTTTTTADTGKKPENPTLADLGLKAGDVCELCLFTSHSIGNTKDRSRTTGILQNDDNVVDDDVVLQCKPPSTARQPQQQQQQRKSPSSSSRTATAAATTTQHPLDSIFMPPSSNLPSPIQPEVLSSANKSSRKVVSSSAPKKQSGTIDGGNISPEIGSDYEDDYDMDYHYSSDEMLDQTEENKITPWNMPLIPDSPSSEDPEMATQQFCIVFLQRYCSDGVTMAPPFSTCSFDTALSLSVGTSQVCDRKPLFIYLHNDNSVACHVFCQQVLCSNGLIRFLTDHEFSLWPWDMTRARAKERLLGWLEVKLPNLSRIITPLPVDSYPLLAMIVKLSGQLEVLCIVMGTGIVKMWPLDPFPPLGAHNPLTLSMNRFTEQRQVHDSEASTANATATPTAIGSLKADVIVAELWQAYTNYLEVLEPECATERELIARRRVLEEQEAAYEESLRRDQQKEWERAKAKAEEDRRRQLEEEQRIHNELKATQHRLSMAASLPQEPPAPKTPAADAFLATPHGSAGITTLRFRLPQGCTVTSTHTATTPATTATAVNHLTNDTSVKNGTIIRRFSGLDLLKHVFIFMESKGFSKSDYKLLTTYPRRDLTLLDENMTLADLQLVPQETLTLELR